MSISSPAVCTFIATEAPGEEKGRTHLGEPSSSSFRELKRCVGYKSLLGTPPQVTLGLALLEHSLLDCHPGTDFPPVALPCPCYLLTHLAACIPEFLGIVVG